MSDQQAGKKEEEAQQLALFLKAYEEVTGERLKLIAASESPDFICERQNGERVGVEMTCSPHDYHTRVDDRILSPEDHTMDDYSLMEAVGAIVDDKSELLKKDHWTLPDNTILVVCLLDYTFSSPSPLSDTALQPDYAQTGFTEVWISDHSTVEAFGAPTLYGVYPPRTWGRHPQPSLEGKPFG